MSEKMKQTNDKIDFSKMLAGLHELSILNPEKIKHRHVLEIWLDSITRNFNAVDLSEQVKCMATSKSRQDAWRFLCTAYDTMQIQGRNVRVTLDGTTAVYPHTNFETVLHLLNPNWQPVTMPRIVAPLTMVECHFHKVNVDLLPQTGLHLTYKDLEPESSVNIPHQWDVFSFLGCVNLGGLDHFREIWFQVLTQDGIPEVLDEVDYGICYKIAHDMQDAIWKVPSCYVRGDMEIPVLMKTYEAVCCTVTGYDPH